ncbi:hypothetical protein M9Y10_014096 [Tritrichomonas musculus]|uniref:Uncharacterized protein n=1 Tax=Tritrichomonas musculus TaxID=1915356 RepID=A0ABR2KYK6_9EUKA
MYKDYLIPIAEKYYHQFVGKSFHSRPNQDLSNVQTKYQTIIQEADKIRVKNEDWDVTNVQSTLNNYQDQGLINTNISYKELKNKYENPQDAIKFLEIEKLKKEILVKIGQPFETELPTDNSSFSTYNSFQENQLDERLH